MQNIDASKSISFSTVDQFNMFIMKILALKVDDPEVRIKHLLLNIVYKLSGIELNTSEIESGDLI